MLTDTGPLVALLDADDKYHVPCRAALAQLPTGPLETTWPCYTEAMYLLGQVGGYRFQNRLWETRRAGRLVLLDITPAEADRMDALMAQYANVPMDMADASLVAVAERFRAPQLFAIDSNFFICRLADGSALTLVR